MRITAFRVKNFRSIVDTGWCNLSPDNITSLIGQNESGKTSILEAIHSFYTDELLPNYLRSDGSLPEVSVSLHLEAEELETPFQDFQLPNRVIKFIKTKGNRINLRRTWKDQKNSELLLEEEDLRRLFVNTAEGVPGADQPHSDIAGSPVAEQDSQNAEPTFAAEDDFVEKIFDIAPIFESFEDFASLLPDMIDLAELRNKTSNVAGFKGAINFLSIAGLSIKDLENPNLRMIENRIEKINRTVTADFREFWTQKIGKTNKVGIELELKHHPQSEAALAGQPYLVFWIRDGAEKLYPSQKSKGVRWFLSFYLHLKASALRAENQSQIFLIDEPGGSLHARAQEDVLKVFEVYWTPKAGHKNGVSNFITPRSLIGVARATDFRIPAA